MPLNPWTGEPMMEYNPERSPGFLRPVVQTYQPQPSAPPYSDVPDAPMTHAEGTQLINRYRNPAPSPTPLADNLLGSAPTQQQNQVAAMARGGAVQRRGMGGILNTVESFLADGGEVEHHNFGSTIGNIARTAAPLVPLLFKEGGNVKKSPSAWKGMREIHASPEELHVMDMMQGRHIPKNFDMGDGRTESRRTYPGLEALVRNPHLRKTIMDEMTKHYAEGGPVNHLMPPALAENGRYGDSEVAMVGPHTYRLMRHFAHHMTHNPTDGRPEFWSLGGLLRGVGNTLGGAARSLWNTGKQYGPGIARTVLPIVAKGIGDYAAQRSGSPEGGEFVNKIVGGAGNALLDRVAPPTDAPGQQYVNQAVEGGIKGLQGRQINNIRDMLPSGSGLMKGFELGQDFLKARAAAQPPAPPAPPVAAAPPPQLPAPMEPQPAMRRGGAVPRRGARYM